MLHVFARSGSSRVSIGARAVHTEQNRTEHSAHVVLKGVVFRAQMLFLSLTFLNKQG